MQTKRRLTRALEKQRLKSWKDGRTVVKPEVIERLLDIKYVWTVAILTFHILLLRQGLESETQRG